LHYRIQSGIGNDRGRDRQKSAQIEDFAAIMIARRAQWVKARR